MSIDIYIYIYISMYHAMYIIKYTTLCSLKIKMCLFYNILVYKYTTMTLCMYLLGLIEHSLIIYTTHYSLRPT